MVPALQNLGPLHEWGRGQWGASEVGFGPWHRASALLVGTGWKKDAPSLWVALSRPSAPAAQVWGVRGASGLGLLARCSQEPRLAGRAHPECGF